MKNQMTCRCGKVTCDQFADETSFAFGGNDGSVHGTGWCTPATPSEPTEKNVLALDALLVEWTERVAKLIASFRVPPSTVYMDGSHNPTPHEADRARKFLAPLRQDILDQFLQTAPGEND